MKTFEELKEELLHRAKEAEACTAGYKMGLEANNKAALLKAITENWRWAFVSAKIINAEYLETNFTEDELNEAGIPCPACKNRLGEDEIGAEQADRKKARWSASTVESILTNEKYKGDALLQKKFTVDFLTKKQKVNEGEVPQYYVTNSHPAIIEPELFDLVQYELKTRKTDGRFTSCLHPFSGRIICGECGGIYGSKVWHSNTENRSLVWQCNEKYRGQHCSTPHLTEGEIKAAFLAAFNIVLGSRDEIIEAYEEVIAALTDTADLDAEQETLENESEVVLGLIQKIISENAQTAMDQEEYNRRYDAYSERFEAARKRLAEIAELRQERNAKKTRIRLFMENMNSHQELVQSFDEELWYSTVDYVTVYEDKRLVFTFRDGRQVEITAELWRAA